MTPPEGTPTSGSAAFAALRAELDSGPRSSGDVIDLSKKTTDLGISETKPGRCPFKGWLGSGSARNVPKASGGRCPFSGKVADEGAAAAPAPAASKCPFSGAAAAPAPAASKCPFSGAAADPAPAAAKCPFSGAEAPPGGADTHPAAGAGAAAAADGPAQCPMGFGSSRVPKTGRFQCTLCKGLYHECTRLGCGHAFCSGCIEPASACPLCGADIESRQLDEELQRGVEAYIVEHAGRRSLWELDSGTGSVPAPGAAEGPDPGRLPATSRSAFLLALGLRQGAAGNARASEARLSQSLEAVQDEIERVRKGGSPGVARETSDDGSPSSSPSASAAPTPLDALLAQKGAVLGVLGDLARGRGDLARAANLYAGSAEALEAVSEPDRSASHALGVTRNKQGDLAYGRGDLAGALAAYREALGIRREAAVADAADDAAQLDLVTSLVKVSDAAAALAATPDAAADGAARGAATPTAASLSPAEQSHRNLASSSHVEAVRLVDALENRSETLAPRAQARLDALARFLRQGA